MSECGEVHPDYPEVVCRLEGGHANHSAYAPEISRAASWPNEDYVEPGTAKRNLVLVRGMVDEGRRAERERQIGRVAAIHPAHSHEAARAAPVSSQGKAILEILVRCGSRGANVSDIANRLPVEVSKNQINTRLGELWESRRAAPLRERGRCIFGVCARHELPAFRHTAQLPCDVHGAIMTRRTDTGRQGAVWVAI